MTETQPNDKKYNVIVIAAVFLLGAFIVFLNSTFMNVALPDIMKDLKILFFVLNLGKKINVRLKEIGNKEG